jgi:hypothetical integral membrane protein (TIGR02206 family)
MGFFSDEVGIPFEEWGLYHWIPILGVILGVTLIYVYRNRLRDYQYERYIRYGMAIAAIVMEISLHLWKLGNGNWHFPDSLPIGLCAFSMFLGIYVMFTKSFKVYEIAYFWSIGGVVSVLFPDIPYGPDNLRYYLFLLSHMNFFFMYMYMLFVHRFVPTKESFRKSFLLLLGLVLLVIIPINFWWNANYMYLREPGDTPFTIFDGHGYLLYAIGCIGLATVVMAVWFAPLAIYHKYRK